jgi:putative ABC transport system permease protein
MWNDLLLRLRSLFRRKNVEAELDDELRFHLENQVSKLVQSGLTPAEAQRRARSEFGGMEQLIEEHRDARGVSFIETLIQDVRYGLRVLRKSPGFTAVAVLTLALGIGASTIVFSVVYSVFFHALPYKDFNKSVVINMRNLRSTGEWKVRSYFVPEEVRALREQNGVFEDVICYARMRPTYDDGKATRFFPFGAVVTANTFDYLGVPPLLGRAISLDDGRPDAPPVFVMNYRLWQREFGGDPKILGTTFILNGKPTTLVGIMPLQFNAFNANFWLPVTPNYGWLQMAGRLKPGVSVATAGANLDSIAHRLHKPNPGGVFPEDKFAIAPQTVLDSLIGDFRKTLYALLGAVFLLLLIACSNVANLLLARATAREREIAMRATLGASRSRIVQQLLVESFVLAVTATCVGYALAYFGLKVVVALIPAGTLPDESVIGMNAPVLLAALGVAILTAILCGLAPALHVIRGDLHPRLTSSGKGVAGGFRRNCAVNRLAGWRRPFDAQLPASHACGPRIRPEECPLL